MQLRIEPGAPLAHEVARIVEAETNAAARGLERQGVSRHKAFHETRKRMKRLRALMRLVRTGNDGFCRNENARYRDLARRLSQARDAGAAVETVDRLIVASASDPGELAAVRAALVSRRDRIVQRQIAGEGLIETVLDELAHGASAAGVAEFPADPEAAAIVLASGIRRNLRIARRAITRARRKKRIDDFHTLRKAVKDHWIHLDLLRAFWPGKVGERRSQARALGDLLGELNDIAVLLQHFDEAPEEFGPKAGHAAFARRLKRRERELRAEGIERAELLFELKPRRVAEEVKTRYERAIGDAHGEARRRGTRSVATRSAAAKGQA